MKVSLNWVKEFTDVNMSVEELVEKIGAQLGAVEEVIDFGKKYQGIVIARVVSSQPHPNADKLSVCKIDDGGEVKDVRRDQNGYVEVVCGAPNVKEDMLVAWLPPGTIVPNTYDKEPLKLEARDIRGVVSNGMLTSARELAISDDHAGILQIDNPGTGTHKNASVDINDHVAAFKNIEFKQKYKPGDDFGKTFGLDDYIIDIENKMFTHRPDLFGILGVAREIAGITHQKFTSPKWYLGDKVSGEHVSDEHLLKITNDLPSLVPRFMAQVIENVKIGSSSVHMQTLLARVGIRPINNIVDVTNYVMYLTGQPMHAYDYDKVKAQDKGTKHASIVIRHPKKGEKIRLLGGKVVEPHPKAIMIASATKLIGIGGVMGGEDTEVDENTQNIILEAANFDMYSIRRTAMEHGLFTDAVTRFTKGQSPYQTDRALKWAVNNIIHEAAGNPAQSIYDIKAKMPPLRAVKVSAGFISEQLGLKFSPGKITELLENVEFKVLSLKGGQLGITPAFWRTDIEIPEDIVEEVGRLHGYDKLPLVLPQRDLAPVHKNESLELKSRIREILSAAGANEILTYSFVHGGLLDKARQDKNQAFKIANALSPDLQYYRLSLTPSLLDKVHSNAKAGYSEFAIFEIGKAHVKGLIDETENKLPLEEERLALVFAADDKKAKIEYGGSPYFVAQKYMTHLLNTLGIDVMFDPSTTYDPASAASQQAFAPFEKTRSAYIKTKERINLGFLGEYRADVRRNLKLPQFVAGFELDLSAILEASTQTVYSPLPRFPKIEQDMSLKVSAGLNYGELYAFVRDALNNKKPDRTRLNLSALDIYRPEDDEQHKHITFRLSIASYERTLTAEEVNALLDKTAAAAKEKFGTYRL